ncbi:hypothetical protein FDZ71_14845 [bacterium]|nr:MAG: hypothetical protein FDZ71_14845 [bacterium]
MRIEERVLRASPELRRMVARCELLARDVKVGLIYGEMTARGMGSNQAILALSKRFNASRSTMKRALKRLSEAKKRELH